MASFIYRNPRGRFTSRKKWENAKRRGDKRWKRQKRSEPKRKKAPPKPPIEPPIKPPELPLRDWIVRWRFIPERERRGESPSRELSWVTRARTAPEAIANVQRWILSEGLESEFDYAWALNMDEQELWRKSALMVSGDEGLRNGEVSERQ